MKQIALRNGMITVVNDEDFENLSQYVWDASESNRYYVVSTSGKIMHREIMRPENGLQVDHINRNPLDNRRENLRLCTRAQNVCNRARSTIAENKRYGKTRQFKGVHPYGRQDKGVYIVALYKNSKRVFQTFVNDEAEGARVYDAKAIEIHAEFAYLNFPDGYESILPDHLIEKLRQEKRGFVKRPEDYA